MLLGCVSPSEKNTLKQLNWDYPPCAGFRKRYVGRIVACLKNAIGSLGPVCDPTRIIRRVILSKRSENVKEIKSSLAGKKHLSFANLNFWLASRGRKSPFVVLSSWVRCFVIIHVTMPYIGSTLPVIRNVMLTR